MIGECSVVSVVLSVAISVGGPVAFFRHMGIFRNLQAALSTGRIVRDSDLNHLQDIHVDSMLA